MDSVVARLVQLDAPTESIAAARKIALPGSVVVVAGQQPVLFGGPGLVWAKACDAIALARALEEKHGVPAIAVFWNASEDHDHTECDHVRMDLGGDAPEILRVPLPGDRRMLARVPVPAEARELFASLRTRFPEAPSRDEILAALEPAADDTMGSWFSRILLRLLGRHGLVVVEPETLRPFARAVVDFEITRPGELAASIRRAEADAVARGEPAALELARDELFFLVDDAGRRLRVTRDGDAWRVEDGRVLTTSALRDLPPTSFSWNVAARVLAQDTALPVAAQICGPSEIVYGRRLAEAHGTLGIGAPTLVHRSQWFFLRKEIDRACRRLGVEVGFVASDGVERLGSTRRESPPPELEALRRAAAALPAVGSAGLQRRHAGLVHAVESYAEALARESSERRAIADSRRAAVAAALFPGGAPQDRSMSPLPWLALRGPARTLDDALSGSTVGSRRSPTTVFHVDLPPLETST
jgi:bacillithiol synthase